MRACAKHIMYFMHVDYVYGTQYVKLYYKQM